MMALAALATTATGLFAGAAAYVTLVEHPARMACGVDVALREWAPSYKRATVMQASLAVIASLAGGAAWFLGLGNAWLAGAILQALVIPFTLIVIFPTNDNLLRAA